MPQTTVTEADSGRTLKIHVGDIVVVQLHENATTGYRWALDDVDSQLVSVADAEYVGKSHALGSGGDVLWRIEAKAPGEASINLKLWRHWEGDTSIQKRFGIVLAIDRA